MLSKPTTLLTPAEAADILRVDEGTLAVWRSAKRHGIPFVKVGRCVRYREKDLADWIESQVQGVSK